MTSDVQKTQERPGLVRVRPATDIVEREDGFHIVMDLPGVSREDVVLDMKENELVVSGRAEYDFTGDGNALAVEFGSGEYRRSFTLSDSVDRDKVSANLKNGVLEIFLPRREKEQPKRIEIKAG